MTYAYETEDWRTKDQASVENTLHAWLNTRWLDTRRHNINATIPTRSVRVLLYGPEASGCLHGNSAIDVMKMRQSPEREDNHTGHIERSPHHGP